MVTNTQPRRLYRSRTNVVFAGVAGGLADYIAVDPLLVRIIFTLVLVGITGPFAPLVYALLAAIIPQAPAAHHARVYDVA